MTPEEIAILKSDISNAHSEIGSFNVAKQPVYPIDDLEKKNDLNQSQFDSYGDEIGYWEDQYKLLVGRYVLPGEVVGPVTIEQAAEGNGLMFPRENIIIFSTRTTGVGDGTVTFKDNDSLFQWNGIDLLQSGDILMTAAGNFAIDSIVDEHTITLESGSNPGTGSSLEYTIFRSLLDNPYILMRPFLVHGVYGGTGYYGDNEDVLVDEEKDAVQYFVDWWADPGNPFIPPATIPNPSPPPTTITNPDYQDFLDNLAIIDNNLDSELSRLTTNKSEYDSYTGSYEDPSEGTVMQAAIDNVNTTKATLDYNSSGNIDISDLFDAQSDSNESVIINAMSSINSFLSGTRMPGISSRKDFIENVLGKITDTSGGELTQDEEQFTGNPPGSDQLYYKRYAFLSLLVDRSNGTYSALKSREVDVSRINDQIAFREMKINLYEDLL